MSNWFKKVTEYILSNQIDYAKTILNASSVRGSRSIHLNPCPFCGHNDAMTLTRGFNGGNCFSCNESGSLIELAEKVHGELPARELLGEWSGIKYNFASHEPTSDSGLARYKRYQSMCRKAMEYYHDRLMEDEPITDGVKTQSPLQHQLEVRQHEEETLKEFQVGYSPNDGFGLFKHLLDAGFTEAEIKKANRELLWIPPGYFVYPYYDDKGNLVRVNCKMFVRYCRGKEKAGGGFHNDCDFITFDLSKEAQAEHEDEFDHSMNMTNFSRGEKDEVFYFNPKDVRRSSKKKLIIIEGENDVLSTREALKQLPASYEKNFAVAGIGGNVREGMFESEFLRKFDEIYEAFDNDEAGEKYRQMINTEMPEVGLRSIEIPEEDNDIDEFLKTTQGAQELFKDMLDEAKIIETQNYKIWRDFPKDLWHLRNRHVGLSYDIEYFKHSQRAFDGILIVYKNGLQSDKRLGNIDKINLGAGELTRLKLALSNEISKYYHDIRWVKDEPQRAYDELLDIFRLTKRKAEVTKQIAWYIFHAPTTDRESRIRDMRKIIKNESDIAEILKEVNGYENQDIDPYANFPKMQVSQSLFPKNGDGYMYFAKLVKDGEIPKRVPCLISDKKEEIRLDLLKKKDAQSLILINNKYELPEEIVTNMAEVEDLSLQYKFVNKWINDEIDPEELHPTYIVGEIETFIRSVYYTTEDIAKVLALWIYSTYFYTLFKSGFPYLVFTGGKGTGKSTLDSVVQLLAFNPTFSVSTSEAALFRSISVFGGTFILDELENMTDKAKVNDSGLAAVIKAGYADNGKILRYSNDLGQTESFSSFGPKVISNISGVEDVIADRCIFIETHSTSYDNLKDLIDPQVFKGERRGEVHSISSRAALSALERFKEVDELFSNDTRVDTGNARLTQILRPLVTIAKLVGGSYEDHLMNFYKTVIKEKKEETNLETLDGKIKHILLTISEEVLGLTDKRLFTESNHIYDKEITVDRKNGIFQLDSMHLKVFAEEMDMEQEYVFKDIHNAVKAIMGKSFSFKTNAQPCKITINDDNLMRALNNKKYVHGQRITFKARDFIPKQTEKLKYSGPDEDDLF